MGLSSTQVCMDYTACTEDKDAKVGMEGGLLTDRRGKPQPEQALKCPRCDSSNTKFCYYNNYSLSQPRYFCKTCRRYWTKGGTLRNVPVGGGCRKNKKPKKTTEESSSVSATSGGTHDNTHNEFTRILDKDNSNIPTLSGSAIYYGNDINMEFARIHDASSSLKNSTTSDFLAMSYDAGVHSMKSNGFSGMEFLKSLRGEHGDVNCLVEPNRQYSDGGGLHNFAPLGGLNSMLYPESYWRLHEQEQQKFEPFSKEIGAGPMVLNLGDQTAENSLRQPKQELFTSLGFTHGGEGLDTARNSIYWNNNGAPSTWPYNYGSSSQ